MKTKLLLLALLAFAGSVFGDIILPQGSPYIIYTSKAGLVDNVIGSGTPGTPSYIPPLGLGSTEATSGTVMSATGVATDQSAALQAIFNTATNNVPLVVYFDGHYCAEGIKVYSNTTVKAAPGCGIIAALNSNKWPIMNGDFQAISGSEIDHNITFEGFTMNANAGTGTSAAWQQYYFTDGGGTNCVPAGFWFIGADYVKFKDCFIYEATCSPFHGINIHHFEATGNTTLTGSSYYFGNAWRDPWHFNGPASDIDIHDNYWIGNDDGVALNAEDVIGGSFTQNGTSATYPSNFGSYGGKGGDMFRVKIHDNSFVAINSEAGIRISDGTYRIDDVNYYNNSGTTGSYVAIVSSINSAIAQNAAYVWSGSGNGNIGTVKFTNNNVVNGGTTAGIAWLYVSGSFQKIFDSNNNVPSTFTYQPGVWLLADGGNFGGNIYMDGWDGDMSSGTGYNLVPVFLTGNVNLFVSNSHYITRSGMGGSSFITIQNVPYNGYGVTGTHSSGIISVRNSDFGRPDSTAYNIGNPLISDLYNGTTANPFTVSALILQGDFIETGTTVVQSGSGTWNNVSVSPDVINSSTTGVFFAGTGTYNFSQTAYTQYSNSGTTIEHFAGETPGYNIVVTGSFDDSSGHYPLSIDPSSNFFLAIGSYHYADFLRTLNLFVDSNTLYINPSEVTAPLTAGALATQIQSGTVALSGGAATVLVSGSVLGASSSAAGVNVAAFATESLTPVSVTGSYNTTSGSTSLVLTGTGAITAKYFFYYP